MKSTSHTGSVLCFSHLSVEGQPAQHHLSRQSALGCSVLLTYVSLPMFLHQFLWPSLFLPHLPASRFSADHKHNLPWSSQHFLIFTSVCSPGLSLRSPRGSSKVLVVCCCSASSAMFQILPWMPFLFLLCPDDSQGLVLPAESQQDAYTTLQLSQTQFPHLQSGDNDNCFLKMLVYYQISLQ